MEIQTQKSQGECLPWGHVSISQGTWRPAGKQQTLEGRHGADSPSKPQEGTPPCRHLDFGLLTSKMVKE